MRHHALDDSDRGSHHAGSYSVSITRRYRAVYVIEEGVNLWYWIGSHADYDRLTGKKATHTAAAALRFAAFCDASYTRLRLRIDVSVTQTRRSAPRNIRSLFALSGNHE